MSMHTHTSRDLCCDTCVRAGRASGSEWLTVVACVVTVFFSDAGVGRCVVSALSRRIPMPSHSCSTVSTLAGCLIWRTLTRG